MIGYIVYKNSDYQRNKWFGNQFVLVFKKYNVELKIILIDNIEELDEYEIPDFVISRVFDHRVCEYYENKNVRCFNNHLTSFYGNNKKECYKLMDKLQIPYMPLINGKANLPYIYKSINGHGGKEVFLIDSKEKENELVNDNDASYIKQMIASTLGKDMRVYYFDSKIIGAVIRYSNNDYRSNFSLGGRYEFCDVEEYQKKYIDKIVKYLKPDFIGIDFINDNGKWVFNEIEDVVGTRILYDSNKFDIIEMYTKHILKEVQND